METEIEKPAAPEANNIDGELSEALARMQSLVTPPEVIAQHDNEELRQKIAALRRSMCAPKRAVRFLRSVPADWSNEALPWNRMRKRVLSTLDQPGTTLAIVGGENRGKTTIAVAAMLESTKRLLSALYVTRTGFCAEIKDARGKSECSKYLRELASYHLLVIDQADYWEWEEDVFLDLINSRHDAELNTIVIVKGSPAELAEKLGKVGPDVGARVNATGGIYHANWSPFVGGGK